MENVAERQTGADPGLVKRRVSLSWGIVCAFTIFYGAFLALLEWQKYFWYDELCTVFFCRLPLPALWAARSSGLELTPIPFHLLTKASQAVFGDGRFGTRLPENVAFWLFCLCLFFFVRRRLGLASGIIAMLFPVFTETMFYAYEARPYALILGLGALALVCWQRWIENDTGTRWLVLFALCFLSALLLHSFALLMAAPFALAELYHSLVNRSIRWRFWFVLSAVTIAAVCSYLPNISTAWFLKSQTDYAHHFPHDWGQIQHVYSSMLAPCIELVIAALVLVAVTLLLPARKPVGRSSSGLRPEELVVSIAFALLPVVGVFGGKLLQTVFFSRYFCPALIGVTLLLVVVVNLAPAQQIAAPAFAALLALFAVCEVASAVFNLHRDVETLIPEPSSGTVLNVSLYGPLGEYRPILKTATDSAMLIGTREPLDFLYLAYYAPALKSRLRYVAAEKDDVFAHVFDTFLPFSPGLYEPSMKMADFLKRSPESYVLLHGDDSEALSFVAAGGRITAMRRRNGLILATVAGP